MMFPLVLIFLNPQNILVNGVDDLLYDDIIKTGASCYPWDACEERHDNFTSLLDPDSYIDMYDSCSCDSNCAYFGTCCIDSPYRVNSPPIMECRNGTYLVSRCERDTPSDSVWKGLCEADWDGEDDITMLAPVTSLDTFKAYKNYYCFRCHETTDMFQYWNLNLAGFFEGSDMISEDNNFNVVYKKENWSWIATSVKEAISIPVTLQFLIPDNLTEQTMSCEVDLITECDDDWTDQDVRNKCKAYKAIVFKKFSETIKYKNPHCAFCNFKSLDDFQCEQYYFSGFEEKDVFSFSHLLNINRPSGGKTGTQCEGNQLWDPYARKCRKIACAIPGYLVKDGRCTPP